jgi:RND family efflux transporter MFP subunit
MSRRFAAIVAMMFIAGCSNSGPEGKSSKAAPTEVVVATPIEKSVTDFAEFTGRTEAPQVQKVQAKVTGHIVEIKFTEGKDVKKGDVLFVIDPRPFVADYNVATSQLELAKARAARTLNDLKRAEDQRKQPGVISAQEYDKYVADKLEADAAVKAAEATVAAKKLDVDYTNVMAEQDGRVSRIYATVGNLITTSTLLTTVVSQDPMYVYFDVDERRILEIQKRIREGTFKSARKNDDVPVEIGLANDPGFPYRGTISFVDNKLDSSTGSMKCRGTFANPTDSNGDRVLSAGLFVHVRLPLGAPRKALLISERAVASDQGQKYVLVVNDKNEVVFRPVTLGQTHDGLRVAESGLSAGDKIIVTGLQRVRPGLTVTPKMGEMK